MSLLALVARAACGKFTPAVRWVNSVLTGAPVAPSEPADITPEWVTQILRESGALSEDVAVAAVDVHVFDSGKTSTVARVLLTYPEAADVGDVPRSLVAKMGRTDLKGRILSLAVELNRECLFYEQVAPESTLNVAQCFHTFANRFTGEFILVIEDIRPSTVVCDEAGNGLGLPAFFSKTPADDSVSFDLKTMESVIDQITGMHVKYLNDPTLVDREWLWGATSKKTGKRQAEVYLLTNFLKDSWKKSRAAAARGEYLSTPWPDDFVAAIETYVAGLDHMFEIKYETGPAFPLTLIHGDFHSMNMLRVGEAGAGRAKGDIVVVDFQVAMVEEPTADIGYMLGQSLSPADLRDHGERLVRRSFDRIDPVLRAQGDNAMPWELYWLRFQMAAMYKSFVLVIVLDSLMADGREEEAWMAAAVYHRARALMEMYGPFDECLAKSQEMRRELCAAAAAAAGGGGVSAVE